MRSIIDGNNEIKNQTSYTIRFANKFCVTICKEFLFLNFAWFGRRIRCDCDDKCFVKIYLNKKYRTFCKHFLKSYITKYKCILPDVTF